MANGTCNASVLLSHDETLNLGNDDHTQYLLLANRAGGQLIGSQGVGRILSIEDSGSVERVRVEEGGDALLQLFSTTQGFGLMSMTEAERDLIPTPSTGLLVFNTTTNQVNQYNGSAWTVPGAGLTTLQGAYDNDPTGAQIVLDNVPNPVTVQASVAGDVFAAQDLGGNTILRVTADPDMVDIEGQLAINDPFLNAGAANSIVLSDTVTYTGGFVGGGILSSGSVTYTNALWIWALLQESKTYNCGVAPGFAAFTLFNALAIIQNSGNFDLVQAIVLNAGVVHSRSTAGTSNTVQTIGLSFAPQTRATAFGAVMTRTTGQTAVQVSPTFATVAGSTVNLGTIIGINFTQPAVALFQTQNGVENMTAYYGINFPNMTFGGASAAYSVVRSQLNTGTNKWCIDHTGSASSRHRGHIQIDVDAFGLILGASTDVLLRWLAAGQFSMFGFGTSSDLQFSTPDVANRFLVNTAGGSTTGQLNFNCHQFSLGAQTGAVGNQIGAFVAPAHTIAVGGEFSQFLLSQAGNLTVDANVNAFAWTVNAPTFTAGTGTLTTAAALNVGGNPNLGVDRVGVRIISNPSGGSGMNAALWVTAGRSRFDGVVDINAPVALGGGAAATLGTIGGSGPATAAQNEWIQIEVNGNTRWIPAWA